MKAIDSVGFWMDDRGRVISVNVSYNDGSILIVPGDTFRAGGLPDDVRAFNGEDHEIDTIHLSNGKTLRVIY